MMMTMMIGVKKLCREHKNKFIVLDDIVGRESLD
jgi:hypothetical protein